MSMLSAGQLAVMRATQADAMADTCIIQTYAATTNVYGLADVLYIDGAAIDCGLQLVLPSNQMGAAVVPAIDAKLRLPLGADLTTTSRIKVTHRNGTELTTAQVFEIVGEPKRGPTGLYIDLKIVTDGSEVGT